MEKTVYILGAGFSQPLGLPVMSNFIDMARDLYATDIEKYSHFSFVFNIIRTELAWIRMAYGINLNNIEEVLSVLEMMRHLDKSKEKQLLEYVRFLQDVIKHYTPTFHLPRETERIDRGVFTLSPPHWIGWIGKDDNQSRRFLFENLLVDSKQKDYCSFVLGLFNQKLVSGLYEQDKAWKLRRVPIDNAKMQYSIISLNYDQVLENTASFLSYISSGTDLKFRRPTDTTGDSFPLLVKLHGSVESTIIAPTWNKTITPEIERDWQAAYELLETANHIKIVGYSLPTADAYVRYLLMSSFVKNDYMKSVSVLCRDGGNNQVQERYASFFKLPEQKYSFSNSDVTNYFDRVAEQITNGFPMENVHA